MVGSRTLILSGLCALLWAASGTAAERRAAPVIDWDQDVRVAWRQAVDADKPLLVFVTMDNCLYCERMKRSTLADRRVVQDLRSQFVPVSVNLKDVPDLVELLEIKSFPTTVVIHTNGDVVESITGYKSAQQLRERLQTSLRVVAQERVAPLR